MSPQIRVRIEYSAEGEVFSYEDFAVPAGMSLAEAIQWVRNEPGGKLALGFNWAMRIIEFGAERALPSHEDGKMQS